MQWLLGGRRISRPGAEYEMAEVKKTTKYTELKLSKNVRAVYRCMEEETDIEIWLCEIRKVYTYIYIARYKKSPTKFAMYAYLPWMHSSARLQNARMDSNHIMRELAYDADGDFF